MRTNFGEPPDGLRVPAATPTELFTEDHGSQDFDDVRQPLQVSQVAWPDERPSARADFGEWGREWYTRFRFNHRGWTWFTWMKSIFPFIAVVQTYKIREYMLGDLLAGATVAAMLIPQGLSYAKLAGLPSVFGLYGGFVPILMYAMLGTSRQLGVGPVAVTSLLLGSGLPNTINSPIQSNPNNPLDPLAQAEYNEAAIQVAFLVGILYTSIGLLNLGWITNFLSHAVISGFMTGASLIIGLSQMKYIFGYSTHPVASNATKILANATHLFNATNVSKLVNATKNATKAKTVSFPRNDPLHEQLADLFSAEWLPYFRWQEFAMGISWIIFILGSRKLCGLHRHTRILGSFAPLLVVIVSTALVYSYGWSQPPSLIRITGKIPSGLPGPTVTWFFPMPNFGQKMLLAVIVCLIDMLESISIARALAMVNGYELNPTAEIRGLGLANIVGACFNCYTTTGSFSRSSVQQTTGAKTQVAGLITSLCIMVVLLALTSLFTYLPLNAMAAIIISALPPLFNWREFLFLWRVNKFDCLVFASAFLCVVFLGVELGLAISIGFSLLIVILYSAFPQITVLGQMPGTEMYRSVRQCPGAAEWQDYLIVRIDAPIYFANLNPIRRTIEYLERRTAADGRHLRFLVLDLSAVSIIDGPAVHFFKSFIEEHRRNGIQILLVQPNKAVIAILMRSGLDELIGREFIGMNTHELILSTQGEPVKPSPVEWDLTPGSALAGTTAGAPTAADEPSTTNTGYHVV